MSDPGMSSAHGATPPQVALAVEDTHMVSEIVGRFEPGERHDVKVLDDPRSLIEHPDESPGEVTIISFPVMRQLAKFHRDELAEFCRNNKAVLLIRSPEFLDSIGFLEFVDGVIFADATMQRVREILQLSKSGYSILPSAAVMDIVTDRLRCDTLGRLSPVELSILDQVRLAKTNRAIARSLGLTEANVKTKVRAILKALKFQNRTEAAVFAARQNELIRQAIARKGKEKGVDPEDKVLPH
ncbi:helix-turn-helix transcriptional regulator [Magnetospirillum sp. UT-4]|uniref:helix-turn-helix transcriptional regulator n=1 Tax=Magnetospirillum sp. UT-4 TaxID=2681467 RepID=UPI00138527FF|nr:LuxR C-terminal-related transcriptional regulator [Magnetospirillum sp. UT-4]CAA7618362.1 putative Transcriptional regulatory protein [Magnetospirillum sp. UT-4]